MKKRLLAGILTGIMMLSMVGCGSEESDLEYIKNKGTLTVGITDFAPMDYNVHWKD